MAIDVRTVSIVNIFVGSIAIILGVVVRTCYISDDYYANLWAPLIIFSVGFSGGRLVKSGGDLKPYMIFSGFSLIVSLAAAGLLIHTVSQFNFLLDLCQLRWEEYYCPKADTSRSLNIVLLVVILLNVVVAGAAIYFVHTRPPATTHGVVIQPAVITQPYQPQQPQQPYQPQQPQQPQQPYQPQPQQQYKPQQQQPYQPQPQQQYQPQPQQPYQPQQPQQPYQPQQPQPYQPQQPQQYPPPEYDEIAKH